MTKEKAQLAGRDQLEEIDRLLEEKEIEETKVKEYSNKNEELVEKIGSINQEIEQISCLQVYLSWVAQISHLRYVYFKFTQHPLITTWPRIFNL